MNFYIQLSEPIILPHLSETAIDVADAIETVFPSEDGFIVWSDIYIPFNYKYDMSVMYDDIPFLINNFKESREGTYQLCFCSNSFWVIWDLEWDKENTRINAHWKALAGGITNKINNSCKYLECKTVVFINEFIKLLKFIDDCIKKSFITIEDKESLQELQSIIQ